MSWPMVEIKKIAEIVTGKTPSKLIDSYFGDSVPFITPAELTNSDYLLPPKEYLSEKGVGISKLIPKGSILVCCIGSLGKIAIANSNVVTNQQINSVIFDEEKVDYRYGFYALSLLKDELKNIAPSTTVAIVNKSRFSEMKIPLPPLEEQKRIAAILYKADNIRRKREQAMKLADDFLRATFLGMFGDPVTNPKGWKKEIIKAGILSIASGWSAIGDNSPCNSDELGVLKISSVTSGKFKPEENKVIEKGSIPASKKLIFPKKGDLIFSRANTRDLVAAICLVNEDYNNIFLPDKLWSIKLTNKKILPEFFLSLIQDKKMRELLTKQATGTSGSMLNISKSKFENTEIIYPEITLQEEYSKIFKYVTKWKDKVNQSEKMINSIFNSLSARIF